MSIHPVGKPNLKLKRHGNKFAKKHRLGKKTAQGY